MTATDWAWNIQAHDSWYLIAASIQWKITQRPVKPIDLLERLRRLRISNGWRLKWAWKKVLKKRLRAEFTRASLNSTNCSFFKLRCTAIDQRNPTAVVNDFQRTVPVLSIERTWKFVAGYYISINTMQSCRSFFCNNHFFPSPSQSKFLASTLRVRRRQQLLTSSSQNTHKEWLNTNGDVCDALPACCVRLLRKLARLKWPNQQTFKYDWLRSIWQKKFKSAAQLL